MVWFSIVTTSRSVSAARRMGGDVEGFDGRHVQHGHVEVVGGEPVGGGQGPHGHQPGGDEHDVAAGAQLGGLAEGTVAAVPVASV
jgi:hypothetical protein